ncbi:unnamed protein product, partial [Rotaria sp. Silwood2]
DITSQLAKETNKYYEVHRHSNSKKFIPIESVFTSYTRVLSCLFLVQKSSTQERSPRISSATIAKPLASNSYVPKVEMQAVSQATSDVPATNKLDVPYTFPNGKFKVIACDMSLYLQERIISTIIPAIEQGGKENNMAQLIKKSLDTEHKPT